MARFRGWVRVADGNSDVWTANLLVARINQPGRLMQSLLARFVGQFLAVHSLSVPDADMPWKFAVAFVGEEDELGQGGATQLSDTTGSVVHFKLPEDNDPAEQHNAQESTLKVGDGAALPLVYDDNLKVVAGDIVVERVYSVILSADSDGALVWKVMGAFGAVKSILADFPGIRSDVAANKASLANVVGPAVVDADGEVVAAPTRAQLTGGWIKELGDIVATVSGQLRARDAGDLVSYATGRRGSGGLVNWTRMSRVLSPTGSSTTASVVLKLTAGEYYGVLVSGEVQSGEYGGRGWLGQANLAGTSRQNTLLVFSWQHSVSSGSLRTAETAAKMGVFRAPADGRIVVEVPNWGGGNRGQPGDGMWNIMISRITD